MEEILSSIKRIIAEDADNADSQRPRGRNETHRKAVVAGLAGDTGDLTPSYVDEVLELTDEMPKAGKTGKAGHAAETSLDALDDMDADETAPAASAPAGRDSIVSVESEVAARSSLAALSSMIISSSEPGDNTLEGLVREMLRPMLKEWLDANLPRLVEGMVAKEIARITGRPL